MMMMMMIGKIHEPKRIRRHEIHNNKNEIIIWLFNQTKNNKNSDIIFPPNNDDGGGGDLEGFCSLNRMFFFSPLFCFVL